MPETREYQGVGYNTSSQNRQRSRGVVGHCSLHFGEDGLKVRRFLSWGKNNGKTKIDECSRAGFVMPPDIVIQDHSLQISIGSAGKRECDSLEEVDLGVRGPSIYGQGII